MKRGFQTVWKKNNKRGEEEKIRDSKGSGKFHER